MREITLSLLFLAAAQVAAANPRFAKYPFGLLGEDHGLLTEQDLAVNTCDAIPEPFSPTSKAYPYWQCFNTSEISVLRENPTYSEDLKAEAVIMAVHAKAGTLTQEYLSPRPISLKSCHGYQKNWRRLNKGEKYGCISGQFNDQTDDAGENVTYWIFDKFKTHRGCVSYFAGDCSLAHQIKGGCGPKVRASELGRH